jgi:hypothetical protein
VAGSGPRLRRPGGVDLALLVLRGLVAAFLGIAAALFLLHGRGSFARFGKPDDARVALAAAEVLGAALFAISGTALAGGILLLVVLAWAAGFHYALAMRSDRLWLDAVVVAALLAATYWRTARIRSEA